MITAAHLIQRRTWAGDWCESRGLTCKQLRTPFPYSHRDYTVYSYFWPCVSYARGCARSTVALCILCMRWATEPDATGVEQKAKRQQKAERTDKNRKKRTAERAASVIMKSIMQQINNPPTLSRQHSASLTAAQSVLKWQALQPHTTKTGDCTSSSLAS